MPYPAQIQKATLIDTAWRMTEAEGFEALSLSRLAAEFGIKAPSLYNHIKNKAELLKAINELTHERLFGILDETVAQAPNNAVEQITAVAHAYRAYALAHPIIYTLAFTTIAPDSRPDASSQAESAMRLQAIITKISGEERSLPALRGMLALLHGFVMLEIHEQLRRPGDLDTAFRESVAAYLRGWR